MRKGPLIKNNQLETIIEMVLFEDIGCALAENEFIKTMEKRSKISLPSSFLVFQIFRFEAKMESSFFLSLLMN